MNWVVIFSWIFQQTKESQTTINRIDFDSRKTNILQCRWLNWLFRDFHFPSMHAENDGKFSTKWICKLNLISEERQMQIVTWQKADTQASVYTRKQSERVSVWVVHVCSSSWKYHKEIYLHSCRVPVVTFIQRKRHPIIEIFGACALFLHILICFRCVSARDGLFFFSFRSNEKRRKSNHDFLEFNLLSRRFYSCKSPKILTQTEFAIRHFVCVKIDSFHLQF